MGVRILRNRMETIAFAANTSTTGTLGSVIPGYGAKTSVLADVQPLTSYHARVEYGTRADRMRQLFMDPGVDIREGYGVWLAGDNQAEAPWRVVSVAKWSMHKEVKIERSDQLAYH